MGALRLEATDIDNEVVDFIDINEGANAEKVLQAGKILRAKQAAGLDCFYDSGPIDIRLVDVDYVPVPTAGMIDADQVVDLRINRAVGLAIREMQADIVFSSNPAAI